MPGAPQSEPSLPPDRRDLSVLGEGELDAALQLLIERAQYITGATGTALALPQGDEMVCRASAGACAPAVGARLQVRSGLTGESIARRQLLRCDNAETDPRVNLETCHALGIASIVVLPLLRRSGEIRGLFELFSDHPYAFEERDLVALERMAALTLTALDLAEQSQDSATPSPQTARQNKAATPTVPAVAPSPKKEIANPQTPALVSATSHPPAEPLPSVTEVLAPVKSLVPPDPVSARAERTSPGTPKVESQSALPEAPRPEPAPPILIESIAAPVTEPPPPDLPAVPEAMRRVQKCSSCGFPVSEGRTLCLDCETLDRLKLESEKKAREKAAREGGSQPTATEPVAGMPAKTEGTATAETSLERRAETIQSVTDSNALKDGERERGNQGDQPAGIVDQIVADEILPPFLTNPQLTKEPWLARHINLLAFLVLVALVLVAAVVFFR